MTIHNKIFCCIKRCFSKSKNHANSTEILEIIQNAEGEGITQIGVQNIYSSDKGSVHK